MSKIKAFILGMIEFRSDCTTNVGDDDMDAYDSGRDFAHKITFRYFDQTTYNISLDDFYSHIGVKDKE